MNFKSLHDSRFSLPATPGKYTWWSRYLGFLPVIWTGNRWTLLNGDKIESVRWYR